MSGKCPKCDKLIGRANMNAMEVGEPFKSNSFRGLAYTCPFCQAILGVQIDPIAIKTDTISELLKELKKMQ